MNRRLVVGLLFPLVALGIGSVVYWHWTEVRGHGDLRWYGLVQFYPMVAIPLLILFYYTPEDRPAILSLVWVVVWYVVAKLLEAADTPICTMIGVSGHTLKHLAAAVSTGYFVQLFGRRWGNGGEGR